MSASYEVSTDQDNIIIRLPRQSIGQESLQKLLDYLELDAIRQNSTLTHTDAETLISEVKQNAWEQVKHLFKED